MAIKYIKILQSKAYIYWDFWLENKPTGNPAANKQPINFSESSTE
jgi:hypothetical protein